MIERRQYERYNLPLQAVVEFNASGRRNREKTQLRDIAIGGASFFLAQPVEVGSELDLSLEDSNNHLAKALGLESGNEEPLRFRVNGRVIRRELQRGSESNNSYAVEFLSPLRISVSGPHLFSQGMNHTGSF